MPAPRPWGGRLQRSEWSGWSGGAPWGFPSAPTGSLQAGYATGFLVGLRWPAAKAAHPLRGDRRRLLHERIEPGGSPQIAALMPAVAIRPDRPETLRLALRCPALRMASPPVRPIEGRDASSLSTLSLSACGRETRRRLSCVPPHVPTGRLAQYRLGPYCTTNTGTLPSARTSDVWLPNHSFLRPRCP
jgi:hypothetical protein